ncbi:MAG: ABC transporter ATP-binding protein [Candidatus Scalindua sp.]|nr:ABC transporter ATP-binding protein [Candidatus Scalindua sp.]
MTRFGYIKVLWYLLRAHKVHFIVCITLILGNAIIMGGALSTILPILSTFFSSSGGEGIGENSFFGKVLSLYSQILPESKYKQIIPLGVLVVLMTVNMAVKFIIVRVCSGLTFKLTCDCRKAVFHTVQTMKYSTILQYSRGMLTQLLITETRSIYAVFKQILSVITTFFNILTIVILLILLSWKLSMILFLGGLLIICTNLYIVRSIKKLGRVAFSLRSELMNKVTEAVWGLKLTKLMSAEKIIAHGLDRVSRQSEQTARYMAVKQGFQVFVSGNLVLGIVFVVVFFWYYFPIFSEGISGKEGLIAFLIMAVKLSPHLGTISREYGTIFASLPAVMKISEFLSGDTLSEDKGACKPVPFFEDMICLRNVGFEYVPGKLVLRGVNLEIKKGAYIGIMGRSGGGKSTMLDLISRINDPTSGRLIIDGIDFSEIKPSYLRSHIGMVTQDFFLFNTSIRENLLLAKPSAAEQELFDALEKAGLLGFVNSVEEKLDYHVGNNGEKLSEGQRQRLCLSTIFLRKPEIIILDEGTSAVDRETEEHILASLRELH